MNLGSFLAASLALASPMMSGQPPLDTGTRDFDLPLLGPAPRRRERRFVDGSLIDTDAVSSKAQSDAQAKADAKRARRAARGW